MACGDVKKMVCSGTFSVLRIFFVIPLGILPYARAILRFFSQK